MTQSKLKFEIFGSQENMSLTDQNARIKCLKIYPKFVLNNITRYKQFRVKRINSIHNLKFEYVCEDYFEKLAKDTMSQIKCIQVLGVSQIYQKALIPLSRNVYVGEYNITSNLCNVYEVYQNFKSLKRGPRIPVRELWNKRTIRSLKNANLNCLEMISDYSESFTEFTYQDTMPSSLPFLKRKNIKRIFLDINDDFPFNLSILNQWKNLKELSLHSIPLLNFTSSIFFQLKSFKYITCFEFCSPENFNLNYLSEIITEWDQLSILHLNLNETIITSLELKELLSKVCEHKLKVFEILFKIREAYEATLDFRCKEALQKLVIINTSLDKLTSKKEFGLKLNECKNLTKLCLKLGRANQEENIHQILDQLTSITRLTKLSLSYVMNEKTRSSLGKIIAQNKYLVSLKINGGKVADIDPSILSLFQSFPTSLRKLKLKIKLQKFGGNHYNDLVECLSKLKYLSFLSISFSNCAPYAFAKWALNTMRYIEYLYIFLDFEIPYDDLRNAVQVHPNIAQLHIGQTDYSKI